jgi:hypothetical protein
MVVGTLGLLLALSAIFAHTRAFVVSQSRIIHFPYVFVVVCGGAFIWFASCFVSGIYLWRGERRGYWMALSLAVFQIAYAILFVPITISFYARRGIQLAGQAILVFSEVDKGLSLVYSVVLLLLLSAFLRRANFNQKSSLESTILSDKPRLRPESIYVIRGLGVANLFFAFLGVLLTLVDIVTTYLHRDLLAQTGVSWRPAAVGAAIDLTLLLGLLYAGYLLLNLNRKGLLISNVVLSVELFYWLGSSLTPSLSSFSNFGLLPQIVTAYPLLALALLNWGAKRVRAWATPGAGGRQVEA